MISPFTEHLGCIEWAAVSQPHPHESVCGDAYFCRETANNVIFAVIDGLGHGRDAALAAETAVSVLSACEEVSSDNVILQCHDALKDTRGAVISVAVLDKSSETISWVGVGNVEGIVFRKSGDHVWMPLRGGIVGCRMPSLTSSFVDITSGDLLVMFTDGLRNHVSEYFSNNGVVGIAEDFMAKYLRGTDDAAVLVARYLGKVE